MSTLKITGMTCDSCAVHVKDALEKVPGVQSADVSYAKGSAKLAIEVGTSPDALTAAVAGLGYRATLADAPSVSTPGGLLDKMRDLLGRNDKTGSSGALHIAVIGSGGKTSLLRRLAEELPGTVLLCTTTHIRPFEEYPLLTAPTPEDIRKALTAYRVLCLGTPCENGKLTAPSLSVETLATLSDYVLVEADGSRQLPLKAHEAHEPVIPAVSRQVICVVGASGFGKPIRESVHRPERFCALTGAATSDPVTPEQAAKAILAEQLCDAVFLNQIDTEAQRSLADRFAAALGGSGLRIAAGSLRAGSGWLYPDI